MDREVPSTEHLGADDRVIDTERFDLRTDDRLVPGTDAQRGVRLRFEPADHQDTDVLEQ